MSGVARQTPALKGRPTYAVLLLLFAATTLAQSPNQSGPATARLAGRIVADESPETPVRGAIVTVSGALPRSRSMVTDDNGAFEFGSLPAGRYTITASKLPYVPMAYGAKRAGRAGTPISLGVGEAMRDLMIRLPKGAVVTGTIRDSQGEILPDITVSAAAVDQPGTQPGARPTLTSVTDDRGMYRIFGIPPGKYLIGATFRVTGLGDTALLSTAEVDRTFAELRRTAAMSVATAVPTPSPQLQVVGFAPTFFPGTISTAESSVLTLVSGEQRTADFAIGPAPTGSIEGVIHTFDGSPLPPIIPDLVSVGPPLPLTFGMGPTLAQRPGPDGRFKFSGVLPGKYTVLARMQPGRGGGPANPLWGLADVELSGQDIVGLSITMQPGARLSGRVVFDAANGTATPDLATLRVALASGSAGSSSFFFNTGLTSVAMFTATGLVRADGTFEIAAIGPGAYTASAPVGSPWTLRSATVNGRDILDTPLEVHPGETLSGAVLTFSDRRTELTGRLQTSGNLPAVDHFVVVFPADAALWRPGSRRTQFVRPATDGQFVFTGLPAGTYLIAALTDVEPEDLADSSFLGQLVPAAAKVTLADGERKTQDLRIAGK